MFRTLISPTAIRRFLTDPVNLLLIALIVWLWFHPFAHVQPRHETLPPLVIHRLDGTTLPLSSLRGQVVLVNFWASWCPYCLKEMPEIRSFYRDWHARGFTVVTLTLDDDPQAAVRYLAGHNEPFIAGIADGSLQQAFGGIRQIPASFIIDRQGVLRDRIDGQVYYGRLQKLVVPLLNRRP